MPGLLDAIYGGDASQIQDAAQRNALLQSLGGLGVGLLQAAQPSPVRQNPFALGLTGALIGGNQAQRAPLDLAKAVADTQNVQAEAAGRQADLVAKQIAAKRAAFQYGLISGDVGDTSGSAPTPTTPVTTGQVDMQPHYAGVTSDGQPMTIPVDQNGHMVMPSRVTQDGTSTPMVDPATISATTRPLGGSLYREFLTGRLTPRTPDEYVGYGNWLATTGMDPNVAKAAIDKGADLQKQYVDSGYRPAINGKMILDPQWEENKSRVAYQGQRATKTAELGIGLDVAQGAGNITGPMAQAQTQFEAAKRYGLQPELRSWVNPTNNQVQTVNTTTNPGAGEMLTRMGWIPVPQGQLPPATAIQQRGGEAAATAIGAAGGQAQVGPNLQVTATRPTVVPGDAGQPDQQVSVPTTPPQLQFTNKDNERAFTEAGTKIAELQAAGSNLSQRQAFVSSPNFTPNYVRGHLTDMRNFAAGIGVIPKSMADTADADTVYRALAIGGTFGEKTAEGITRLTNMDVGLFQKQIPGVANNPNAIRTLTNLENAGNNFELQHQQFLQDKIRSGMDASVAEKQWRTQNFDKNTGLPNVLRPADRTGLDNFLKPTEARVPMFKSYDDARRWGELWGWTLDVQKMKGFLQQTNNLYKARP